MVAVSLRPSGNKMQADAPEDVSKAKTGCVNNGST